MLFTLTLVSRGVLISNTGDLKSHKIYTGFYSYLLGCSTKLHNNIPVTQHITYISVVLHNFSGLLKLFSYVGKPSVEDYANLIQMLLNLLHLIGILLIYR